MKIGIIDADLIGRQEHNFPNLASMKISGYHKKLGDNVKLIHFDDINPNSLFSQIFDKVYISKVFTDTKVPEHLLKLPFVSYGGTGFFYDKDPNLPYEIEHSFPDYDLYNDWIKEKIKNGKKQSYFKYYTDFSIGFTTRGCFRQCGFCVNRNEKKVYLHSPLNEFVNVKRKKICLLDDNVLGIKNSDFYNIFEQIKTYKKQFEYKQGIDIRLLSKEKCNLIQSLPRSSAVYCAFDNIDDRIEVEKGIKIWHDEYMKNIALTQNTGNVKLAVYILCGFDRKNFYNFDFFYNDIISIFERLIVLQKYKAYGYIMKHENYKKSPFKKIIDQIKNWVNQQKLFSKMSFNEYINSKYNQDLTLFKKQYPEIAEKYFDMKFGEVF